MKKVLLVTTVLITLLGVLGVALAQEEQPTPTPIPLPTLTPISSDTLQTATYLVPEVIAEYPHDNTAYTQGLLLHEGHFYESPGRRGASNLREVDPETGEVLRQVPLSDQIFAEGLARVDDRLIQITWTEQIALHWDLETFTLLGVYYYQGEGWGLCYDGEYLWMSNGSSNLTKRDAAGFRALEEIPVTLDGEPRDQLNELECVGDYVYANVYKTDYIVQIEKATGEIVAVIDASNLLTEEERAGLVAGTEVLNGIAYDEEKDVFYITGKHWSKLFEVRFVEPS